MKIIGLTGLAGHGKTEVAKILQHELGYRRIALADPLKKAASQAFCIQLAYFYEGSGIDRNKDIAMGTGMTIREIMTTFGDAMKNTYGGSFWIDRTKTILQLLKADHVKGVIIEDIRYDANNPWGAEGDELSAVRNWGGTVMHVDANTRCGRSDVHNNHSEKGVERLAQDVVIDNNGTPAALAIALQQYSRPLKTIRS